MKNTPIKKTLKPVSMATIVVGCLSSHAVFAQNTETQKTNNSASNTSLSNTVVNKTNSAINRRDKTDKSSQEHITVTGQRSNILKQSTGVDLLPQDVMHTPQNITVIPKKVMEEQNVKSLDEALKNVPGITSSIGEGRGGMSGNQFLIRGFPAQNDIYEDGLRDFGVYSRDSFNYDSVVVIKGPSSSVFGNGTTGGAINVITKKPILDDFYNTEFSGGNGDYYRGTLDFNKKLGDSVAVRMVGMGNSNNFVGRNYIYSHRWGLAPSIAVGLNKKASYVLQVFHQEDNRIPDYGVPFVTKPGNITGKPVTEYGVNRNNWYGNWMDHDRTNDNQVTGRFTYQVTPKIVIHNDTRYGNYYRDYSVTRPSCPTATCNNVFFSDHPEQAITNNAGPDPYQQKTWSFQNVLSSEANFHTSFIRHQLVGGVDIAYANERRVYGMYSAALPNSNLLHPKANLPYPISIIPDNPNGTRRDPVNRQGHSRDVGVFIYDQIWFTKQWSIKGGVRYDNWNTYYNTQGGNNYIANNMHTNNNIVNPSVSLMYMPDQNQMYYFTWATSTTPLGMYLTNSYAPMQNDQAGMKPEKSRLYELGGKWTMLAQRVGLTAALFRLEKSNQLVSDPLSGDIVSSGDKGYNEGIELGLSGTVLPHWDVLAGFSAYHSRITSSQRVKTEGNRMQYVPQAQGSLWTTYEIAPHKLYNLTLGGGVTWRGSVWLETNKGGSKAGEVPYNFSLDAMLSHKFNDHWKVAMNIYNITNRLNYDALFGALSDRATPATGRAFMFTLKMTE